MPETDPFYFTITNRAPQYHVADAPWGTQYAGYRGAGPGRTYWRFANFLFPCWSQAPNGEFDSHMHARGWVPIDDGHTMFVFIWWKKAKSAQSLPQPPYKDGTPIGGTGRGGMKMLPNTTDWLGRWRMALNEGNDWGMDRDKQRRNEIYSGIDGIHLQDQAITESMGPVTDFDWEHLAPSDQMITRTRRRLLLAARALRDEAVRPPGADEPDVYRGARSGYFITPDDRGSWQEVYARTLAAAVHPPRCRCGRLERGRDAGRRRRLDGACTAVHNTTLNGAGDAMAISLKVNGSRRSVPAEPDTPLLYVLRNDLELNGAKFGCGLAQCGACTVLIDGRAVRSCVTPIGALGEAEITTIEGLGTIDKPHPLQQAFIDEQAAQCGYCINGMIMTAKELLDRNPRPTRSRGPRGAGRKPLPLRHPRPDRPRGAARGASDGKAMTMTREPHPSAASARRPVASSSPSRSPRASPPRRPQACREASPTTACSTPGCASTRTAR